MTLYPLRIEGLEHVPRDGGFIVAGNHISWLDPPFIEFALRRAIRYMAKEQAFETPVTGFLMRAKGCFPVRRGEADRRALAISLAVLAAGLPLGLFPEGTRSPDGALRAPRPGVGLIARRSGAPILPVGVVGSDTVRPFGRGGTGITVRVGPPFRAADLSLAEAGPGADAVAEAIMWRIAALLPERMRGAYASSMPASGRA